MFLRSWSPSFELKDDLLRVLPLCVTLPHLPLNLWGERSISKIASAIGKLVVTDECTAKKLQVSYAHVLIEVDVTKKLRDHVVIKDHLGKRIEQSIEYEWKPIYCDKCLKVGHNCGAKTCY